MKSPENYKKELLELAKYIPGYHQLEHHQKQTSINNALLNLINKMNEGLVDADDYEVYKHYMFITLRNAINRHFAYQKTLKGTQERIFAIDIEANEPIQRYFDNLDYKSLKQIIGKLKPIDRAIFRWSIRNWTQIDIANALGMTPSSINARMAKIRKKLQMLI